MFLIVFRALSTSITADNIGQSNPLPSSPPHASLINTFDAFESRQKSMSISSSHPETIPPVPTHPRSMTINADSMNL